MFPDRQLLLFLLSTSIIFIRILTIIHCQYSANVGGYKHDLPCQVSYSGDSLLSCSVTMTHPFGYPVLMTGALHKYFKIL